MERIVTARDRRLGRGSGMGSERDWASGGGPGLTNVPQFGAVRLDIDKRYLSMVKVTISLPCG